MEVHNVRSPEQWEIIRKHIDVAGKIVIDLGCGYGDIMTFMAIAGAITEGVDVHAHLPNVAELDICEFVKISGAHYDIGVCFSVIPYLGHCIADVLLWMRDYCDVSLIEIQYEGDGPGVVRDDVAMREVLLKLWPTAWPIGKTLVDGRNTYRTIWMCK